MGLEWEGNKNNICISINIKISFWKDFFSLFSFLFYYFHYDLPKANTELLYFIPGLIPNMTLLSQRTVDNIEKNLGISALPYTISVILGQLNFSLSFSFFIY